MCRILLHVAASVVHGSIGVHAGDKQLYQVLEQQATNVGTGIMGGDHTYLVPSADQPERQQGSAAAMRRYDPPPPSLSFPLILLLFAIEIRTWFREWTQRQACCTTRASRMLWYKQDCVDSPTA